MFRRARSVSFVVMSLFAAVPAFADSLSLAWDPNTDTVSGYAVYVGVTSGSYSQRFDVGGTTAFTYSSATAGQRYCFAVAAYSSVGEGPKSSEVCGYSNRYPTLTNPGNQSSTVGQSVSLQLAGSDPDGQAVSYTATGLPAGLSLMSATGFISGSGTTSGTFSVTARVSDGVLSTAQTFSWTMNAAATVPTQDTTLPVVSIATPTTSSSFATSTSTISLSGTASDNVGVSLVSWVNDRGGNGTASGTTSWNAGTIALQGGVNNITVSARDAAGNIGVDLLAVTYNPPVSSTTVTLSGSLATRNRWQKTVSLTWTAAPWSGVTVYLNGSRLTKTANDGSYTDSLRSSGTYTYKICDPNSTVCSNTVTIYN